MVRGVLLNIPGNAVKHSGGCTQAFWKVCTLPRGIAVSVQGFMVFVVQNQTLFTDKIKTKSKITLIEKKGQEESLPVSSRGNSFRRNNYRRSGCSRSF